MPIWCIIWNCHDIHLHAHTTRLWMPSPCTLTTLTDSNPLCCFSPILSSELLLLWPLSFTRLFSFSCSRLSVSLPNPFFSGLEVGEGKILSVFELLRRLIVVGFDSSSSSSLSSSIIASSFSRYSSAFLGSIAFSHESEYSLE